jgi:hypothetical protein
MRTLPIRFPPSAFVLFGGRRVHAGEPNAREAGRYVADHQAADDVDPASASASDSPSRA